MVTYKILISNSAVFVLLMMVFFVDTFSNMSFLRLFLYGFIHSIWIIVLYIIVNFAFNKSAFKTLFEMYRGNREI